QVVAHPGRDVDDRIAHDRRRRGRTVGREVVSVDQVGRPGRAVGGRDDRVQVVRLQQQVDALAATEELVVLERLHVGGDGRRVVDVRVARRDHQLLAEVPELLGRVSGGESDDVANGVNGSAGPGGQVRVEVLVEVEEQ